MGTRFERFMDSRWPLILIAALFLVGHVMFFIGQTMVLIAKLMTGKY